MVNSRDLAGNAKEEEVVKSVTFEVTHNFKSEYFKRWIQELDPPSKNECIIKLSSDFLDFSTNLAKQNKTPWLLLALTFSFPIAIFHDMHKYCWSSVIAISTT